MAISTECPCEDKDVMLVQDKLGSIIAELQQIKVILSRHMAGLVCSKDTEVHVPTSATHFMGVQHTVQNLHPGGCEHCTGAEHVRALRCRFDCTS